MSRTLSFRAAATAITALIAAAPAVTGQDSIRLDRILDSQVGDELPEGWTLRAVGGQERPTTSLERIGNAPALVMRADSAAGQAWLELDDPFEPGQVELHWEWRVAVRPPGAALREPERDDSPARFFVVFGGGGLFGRPHVLFYSWGTDEMQEAAFSSHVSDRVGVIVVRNSSDKLGAWVRERRNLAADFRRVFGGEPDEVRALGLMADTDQLGGRAEVHLREVRIEPLVSGSEAPERSR